MKFRTGLKAGGDAKTYNKVKSLGKSCNLDKNCTWAWGEQCKDRKCVCTGGDCKKFGY